MDLFTITITVRMLVNIHILMNDYLKYLELEVQVHKCSLRPAGTQLMQGVDNI